MSNPMKKIIIKSQDEFDKIKRVNVDEEVIFESKTIQINFCKSPRFLSLSLQ